MFKNIRQLTPFAIILLAIAFTMSISQSTMTTAYPVLMRNFQVDAGTVQWLTTGYGSNDPRHAGESVVIE